MRQNRITPARRRTPHAIPWLVLLAGAALSGAVAPQSAVLDRWDLQAGPSAQVRLASSLREVSGLAVATGGRLFAHDDERAEIHELDPATGRRLARFGPGRVQLEGDFEGLAWAVDRFFLITSEGTLAEFPMGGDGDRVEYRRHVTGLNRTCEVEGLTYDSRARALLIACKRMYEGGPPGIYAFELDERRLDPRPRFVVRSPDGGEVEPSGIVVDAASGHILVIAARQRRMIELDRTGRFVAERALDRASHPQAEGIELLPDGTLVLADEGAGGQARLAWYRPVTAR